ncbi:MAG: ABC transporter ATP-binding protein [Rhodospirillales bacterium]|jgi:ABC-2 type transport system ATP-binding protein|nr:ABC transporter ATP-binding protein [Rhodospirillales bacterium]MDP6644705.1 ABC transporter ATP-binding protein [Rhodospirillales bacterium]MDP6842077.1 ABC transporter ATP-binding protein [Rhodospirillales bacterium]
MVSNGEMITTEGLSKRFGALTAVDNVSFSVGKGEVLGFLGPNGAGKSTTMKMLTGYLPITSGRAAICGFDVESQQLEARKRVGYLPEGAPLYGDMTAAAFLGFIAEVRGYTGSEKAGRVEHAKKRLGLEPVFNKPIETLSKGYKRRVGLAQAILHDPEILILDEPTDGLDPNQKHQVRELISEMAADKAIIISTHILEEVSAVCSRAMIIAEGKIVFDGSPDQLAGRSPTHNAVTVRVAGGADQLRTAFDGLDGIDRIEADGDGTRLIVFPKDGAPIIENVSALVRAKGLEVEEVYVDRGQLDDVFRLLTMNA